MENQQVNPINQETLPNSIGVLVLGILSIVFCFCYGIIGVALGIIALILANKAIKIYMDSPESYTEASYKNVKAGKICAIVGLSLSSLYIVFLIIYIGIIGAAIGGGMMEGLGGY